MKHPQTVIQKFNNNACLFMCYLYCVGLEPDTIPSWLDYFKNAYEKGFIDDECFVQNAEGLIRALTGRKVFVLKKDISKIEGIIGPSPVWYSKDGKSGHFVVVQNGKIIFNPLEKSINVNEGKPRSVRIITYAV